MLLEKNKVGESDCHVDTDYKAIVGTEHSHRPTE
jgi:hypothetical protein